jgi:hypothetical protein
VVKNLNEKGRTYPTVPAELKILTVTGKIHPLYIVSAIIAGEFIFKTITY